MGLALSARLISENRAVLAVRGCLNAVTAFPFKARIEGLVKEGRREIVCDLTEVGSLDSSGLAALIAGVRAAGERGGFFRFVVQTEQVARIFKLTMLDRVFEMYASVEAALGLSVDRARIFARHEATPPATPIFLSVTRSSLRVLRRTHMRRARRRGLAHAGRRSTYPNRTQARPFRPTRASRGPAQRRASPDPACSRPTRARRRGPPPATAPCRSRCATSSARGRRPPIGSALAR